MKIAVLREELDGERRVAATPETCKKFAALGATLAVEAGAGETASIADADYAAAGATVASRADIIAGADILLAVQGPKAAAAVARLVPGVETLVFMTAGGFAWRGHALWISRSGYTGEDGFEVSLPAEAAAAFADALLAQPEVKPIGLGARDSLRLEAGLPLYGHELDPETTPVMADLGFALSKRRREEANFPGAPRILLERQQGPITKRVGLLVEGRQPVREGAAVIDAEESEVGTVGISDYAQGQLGDIVFVETPDEGKELAQGDEAAVVESVKAASDVYCPASGTVIEANSALEDEPALVNTDPEGEGWFFRLTLSDPDEVKALLDESAYAEFVAKL